ncbi:beta-lactamase family protein [Methanocalculus taiwanensis]|uniref:Beta-lactamase family protein n=1 Tax=Methanocalculus taiwanensis TaxID=106207 RepID=A0ABD4TL60_9EURY|nr:serine hydrolase domain-containing protein [Methanocalculus taiwanensis]MCQ1539571.1 beta-lactamase family protein [Methanocalculus taiwanensis]
MNVRWIFFFLLIICLALIPQAVCADELSFRQTGPTDPDEVEAFLDLIMPANLALYNVPGATVAVVKDGELVIAKGYGYSDLEKRVPVDADQTLFRIGSITKLFTWTAVMQLQSEGRIDLDTDINQYLKDFSVPDTYPGKPITMRHLMTHTAGFEECCVMMEVENVDDLITFREYCAGYMPARINPPGTITSYSNYGTTLAAVVVEDITGIPFEEYLDEQIIIPLGMDSTSIREDLPSERAERLSNGYIFGKQNQAAQDSIFTISPAGSISSTAPDMAAFLAMHMKGGSLNDAIILPRDTAELMHAEAFTNDPRGSGVCLGFYEMHVNNRRLIGHGGDTNTFHSLLIFMPTEQAGFFVSYNSVGGGAARNELLRAFMNHYYPAEEVAIPDPDPSNTALLQQYAGTYETNRRNFAHFEKYIVKRSPVVISVSDDGTLLMDYGGTIREYYMIEPDIFALPDGDPQGTGNLIFHFGSSERVEYFVFSNVPIFAFDRLAWYDTPAFLENVVNIAGTILATVLLWPLLALFRRSYAIPKQAMPRPARIARWIAGASAVSLLGFVFLIVPKIIDDKVLVQTYMTSPVPPFEFTLALTVPVISLLLTLLTAGFAAIAWKEGYWSRLHRIHYTAVAAAAVAMLWWIVSWNLWVFSL